MCRSVTHHHLLHRRENPYMRRLVPANVLPFTDMVAREKSAMGGNPAQASIRKCTENPDTHTKTPLRKGFLRTFVRRFVLAVVLLWWFAVLILVAARWIDPPTTAVHMERRLQAWIHNRPYQERYQFVPLSQISPDFQHAVIAAEDARFYQHHGFDWHAMQIAAEDDMEGGRIRGGSTLTQQLVKNLFFGTGRSILRKGAEFTLVPVAELVLGKQRILGLYLNVVEWGPGVYGAESACRYYYRP